MRRLVVLILLVAGLAAACPAAAPASRPPARQPAGSSPTPRPLVVLIGGLSSQTPSREGDPRGGAWKFVKRRLEAAGYDVYAAATGSS